MADAKMAGSTLVGTEFLDALASSAPTPGGGGASAYCGALAAALSSMVGNLTTGKKRYADVEPQVQEHLAQLEDLRARLVQLVDADAEAFAPLAAAYRMPKETPEEQAAKEAALQAALVEATRVPLVIMRCAAEVFDHAEFMARFGSRLAVSDAGVSAAFACAAVEGASLNVLVNAASLADKDAAQAYLEECEALCATARARSAALLEYVRSEISS